MPTREDETNEEIASTAERPGNLKAGLKSGAARTPIKSIMPYSVNRGIRKQQGITIRRNPIPISLNITNPVSSRRNISGPILNKTIIPIEAPNIRSTNQIIVVSDIAYSRGRFSFQLGFRRMKRLPIIAEMTVIVTTLYMSMLL